MSSHGVDARIGIGSKHSTTTYLKWIRSPGSIRNRGRAQRMLQDLSEHRSFADDDLPERSGAREFFE